MSEIINWFKRFVCINFKIYRRCKAEFKQCQRCACNYGGSCIAHLFFDED